MSPPSPRQLGAGASAGAGVARHAVFKVHRDSHSIHKATSSPPSSSSTNSSVSSSSSNAIITTTSSHRPAPAPPPPPRQKQPPQQQQQQPVIIYTHSPKVIRTNPRDFMSIVQKLTGLDSAVTGPGRGGAPHTGSIAAAAVQDESSSSSSESCGNTHTAGPPHPYADSQLMPPPALPLDAHFMPALDIPLLFASDNAASDLQQLCAPRPGLYGHFPPVYGVALGPVLSTNMNSAATSGGGAVFSPSMVETTVRTSPDYN